MPSILLDAYAARSCAVKTHNSFDSTLQKVPWEPEESVQELFDGGNAFEASVLDQLAQTTAGTILDLRELSEEPLFVREGATTEAMAAGFAVIIAPLLPVDAVGHRTGAPDLLIRGADRANGKPGYHVAEVKWHRIHERKAAKAARPNSTLTFSRLDGPDPSQAEEQAGLGLRVASREADWLQLAHYYRMLQAMGSEAPGAPLAAVIGNDPTFADPVLGWLDLAEPLIRTFSRSHPDGWKMRSVLERYDHEHGFRVKVAERAQRIGDGDTAPLVTPIVTSECGRCAWWDHCRSLLNDSDVSLKIEKGALDVREIGVLRQHRITTITDLARIDLDSLLTDYLPEVTHRSGAEERLRLAARRARMLVDGIDLERITCGPISLPAADLEIDFDVETSVDGRVYLWGFLINDRRVDTPPVFKHFSSFDDLDDARELALAHQAMGWLRELTDGPATVRVYHYSDYEIARIKQLTTPDDPLMSWAREYAESEFIDLWQVIKSHYFGVHGLGLKVVATAGAGFHWRDEDPGGLNSQRWFTEAVHGETEEIRQSARRRVLDYNEDDVIATSRVRQWLRRESTTVSD